MLETVSSTIVDMAMFNQQNTYALSPLIVGSHHRIVLADGQEIWTSASNLSLMDPTSLTDIPFDVKSYCGEVDKGLSGEQIVLMARPKTLTRLQQELMLSYEKLYPLS